MKFPLKHSKSAFTLVELLIVIFMIWVIATTVKYVNFSELNARKRIEVFTNHVSRVFESSRNNALLWRSFWTNNPEAWRVLVSTTNSGTFVTQYLSGSTWTNYDERDFTFEVDFPEFISRLNCDVTWDISSGTWIVEFRGRAVSFTWACGITDKILTIDTNFSAYSWSLEINAVSGVIEITN